MKTLFSLKTRIGAILTAATLTAAAVPMTGLAATASTTPNLIVNGDFSKATKVTEDVTYDETNQVTVAAASHPDDWEIKYDKDEYDIRPDGTARSSFGLTTAKNVMFFGGNAFTASQKVKGIEPGKRYSIEFGARTAGDNTALVTVKFLHYDEETDTYQTIKEYIDAQNEANGTELKLLTASVNQDNSTDTEYTEASYGVRMGTYDGNVPMTRNFNFITPPYTNAVEVVLGGTTNSNQPHPNQYIYIDNVTLRRSSEVVINGDFADVKNKTQCAGWTGNIAATNTLDGTGNCYTITSAGSATCPQNVILKSGQTYKVTFKYKHTLGDNVADKSPFFNLSGRGDDYKQTSKLNFKPELIGTDGDWDIYEGYITAPEGLVNEGYFLMGMLCRSRALKDGESWDDGYTMSYDDISIVEATTLTNSTSGGATIAYSPAYKGDTASLIVAKYVPGTDEFVGIEVETIGADAEAGYVTTYIASMAGAYDVKAFLWDGLGTMKPITAPITRASSIYELPYSNTFSSAEDAARVSYQDISTRDWANTTESNAYRTATVSIEDGKLVQKNVSGYWHWKNYPSRICGNGQLTIDFKPQSTGTLVVELDRSFTYEDKLTGKNSFSNDGFLRVEDADGNVLAAFRADGRGASNGTTSGNNPFINGAYDETAHINNPSWMYNHNIKYEINFDTKKYQIYVDDALLHQVTTDTEATPVTEFAFAADSASKLVYNYSCNGEALDNIRIYKKIEAAQTETSFNLEVGDTATAAVTYTPSTESMYDMTFTSGCATIADVTANGLIRANRAGTTVIKAKSEAYGAELTWNVTVTDGRVVTPVTVPYEQTFDTDGLAIKDLDGWSAISRQADALLTTQDGKLVLSGVKDGAADATKGAAQLKLDFGKQDEGKLAIELDYKNINGSLAAVKGNQGVFTLFSEDGTRMGGIRADGRGDFRVYDDDTLISYSMTRPWYDGVTLKIEIDFDAGTYFVYRNGELVANTVDTSVEGEFFLNSKNRNGDVAYMVFNLTNNGDYLDDVKVYVPSDEADGDFDYNTPVVEI